MTDKAKLYSQLIPCHTSVHLLFLVILIENWSRENVFSSQFRCRILKKSGSSAVIAAPHHCTQLTLTKTIVFTNKFKHQAIYQTLCLLYNIVYQYCRALNF